MIYLDNAATSFPKPEAVYSMVDDVLRRISGSPGRASHRMAIEAGRVVFNAREVLSGLLGIPDSSRIAFTKNATEAINIALKGILRPGDHAVTTTFEHNSVVKTLGRLEKDGVSVTKVRPDREGLLRPKDILGAIRKETKLVTVVHASNVFGTIEPIEEIGRGCRERGVYFMVDAAQTIGAVPVNIGDMEVDIIAATGHKALFGPQGTGFIYVRNGMELEPLIDGGTGDLDTMLEMPDRLESGTMNMPGIGGLYAGAEFLLKEGVDKVRERETALVGEILSGLGAIDGVRIIGPRDARKRASLVAFNVEGVPPAEAGRRLDEGFSILVRSGAHCAPEAHREAGTHPDGAVRVSPGYFTKPEDIEAFLRAVRTIAKG
ncbi:MAG: aminotransferase class V-fold PLP-dependent enzyme [Deltaproteobacteria bacterium]|nr:aminotransferase class V-fold PLP-dependent enzyme [Deltaproteobacteria bacterium]